MTDKVCKICGCKEKNKLFRLCSDLRLMGEHFPKSESVVVECPACGFVYVDMEANQTHFNGYYTSPNSNPFGYYELYGEENTNAYFEDILNKFSSLIGKESAILDFAGGSGDFVKFLHDKGYKNAEMLEISQKCADIAFEKGVKTIISDGCELKDELNSKYDLITMIHSIEHFEAIDKVIKNAKKMLKPEGLLYIEVPDADKYASTEAVPYTMFTFEHIYHFNLNVMDNIWKNFGLELFDKGQFHKAESYDVLWGLYKNSIKPCEKKSVYSSSLKESILNYKQISAQRLKPFIKEFERTQEKLILWGIGASTAILMNGTFDNCNVIKLADRNEKRQGIEYKIGEKIYKVESPDTIKDSEATILMLPYWYHDSIMKQIKDMGLKNPVKALM